MLSIFCPYRNRDSIFRDFIEHYEFMFPQALIYMVEQDDNEPFKRGQLANVIFNILLSEGKKLENIAFVDIDLRLQGRIDFEGILERNRCVTVPFNKIETYNFIENGKYETTGQKSYFLSGDKVTGGITLYTKSMFEDCKGFSNVFYGWGCEDSDFLLRNPKNKHEGNTILHLEHLRDKKNHSYIGRNVKILEGQRTDPNFDGFKETTVKSYTRQSITDRSFHYKVQYIGVIEGFRYEHML